LVLHDRHFCGKLSGIFDRAFLAEKDQVIEQPGAVPVESREKLHYDVLLAASSQPPSLRRPENLMKCRGCGVELDPSEEQVHSAVDRILGNSRQDAQKKGGVCPLCGRSQKVPYSHRRTVLLGLLLACLIVVALNMQRSRQTKAAVCRSTATGSLPHHALTENSPAYSPRSLTAGFGRKSELCYANRPRHPDRQI
jgi:hypothetical protein